MASQARVLESSALWQDIVTKLDGSYAVLGVWRADKEVYKKYEWSEADTPGWMYKLPLFWPFVPCILLAHATSCARLKDNV